MKVDSNGSWLRAAAAMSLCVLSACNTPETDPLARTIPDAPAPDPIQTGGVIPTPTPTLTSTPSPTPTSTVTPKPTATPTPAPTPTTQPYVGDAALSKYVNAFIQNASAQGVNVLPYMKNPTLQVRVASLSTVSSSTIGLCEFSGSLRRVTLDSAFWNSSSETYREILMHHELGHCVLERYHTSTRLSSGQYASIMTPYILNSSVYAANKPYYVQELYRNRAIPLLNLAATDEDAAKDQDLRPEVTHVCDHDEVIQ
jgi:hypothetical protein